MKNNTTRENEAYVRGRNRKGANRECSSKDAATPCKGVMIPLGIWDSTVVGRAQSWRKEAKGVQVRPARDKSQ